MPLTQIKQIPYPRCPGKNKPLRILGANRPTKHPPFGFHKIKKILSGDRGVRCIPDWVKKLGTKSKNSLHLFGKKRCDIYHEIRVQLFVLNVMINCLGSPFFLLNTFVIKSFNLFKSRIITGIQRHFCCTAMVGMAIIWGITQYNLWSTSTKDSHDFQPVFWLVLKKSIGNIQGFAEGRAQDLGGLGSFCSADFCATTCAEFSLTQIKDAKCLTQRSMSE